MEFKDIIDGAIGGAVGYYIGRKDKNESAKAEHDLNIEMKTLSGYIEDYAIAHGIYDRNRAFAMELREIADRYDDPYGSY